MDTDEIEKRKIKMFANCLNKTKDNLLKALVLYERENSNTINSYYIDIEDKYEQMV
jgi:hypothetical protein